MLFHSMGLTCRRRARLSRSLKDLLYILEKIDAVGAGFRSLTESIDTTTAAGRMLMQMLGAFAHERSSKHYFATL